MGSKEDSIKEAYIQGSIDALKIYTEAYELGREAAKQIYK